MGGDGAANAEVSGSEREGERGRSDARVEPASFSVGNAEGPEADVPPGLWQFAGKKLREAYFHAARASVRDLELNPRPARDEDRAAADPPDPEPGVRRVLSAIRDLAVASARMSRRRTTRIKPETHPTRSAGKRKKRARGAPSALGSTRTPRRRRGARARLAARRRRFSSTTFPKRRRRRGRKKRNRETGVRETRGSRAPRECRRERAQSEVAHGDHHGKAQRLEATRVVPHSRVTIVVERRL